MSCTACQKPLTLAIEADDEDDLNQDAGSSNTGNIYTVPDSVEMQCGCHFHWFVFRRRQKLRYFVFKLTGWHNLGNAF